MTPRNRPKRPVNRSRDRTRVSAKPSRAMITAGTTILKMTVTVRPEKMETAPEREEIRPVTEMTTR